MAQTIENKLSMKENIKRNLAKIAMPFLFPAFVLGTSGCATLLNQAADEIMKPSPEQIEKRRAVLEKAYREDFPKTFDDVMRSKRLISYVENDTKDKTAVIWRVYQPDGIDRDNDLFIVDKNRTIYAVRTPDVTEYAVEKTDDKIILLGWEFGKYGESTVKGKTPKAKKWEHSKCYTINWDGTGKQEVDKSKYYYYDAAKDDVFFKFQETATDK